MNAALLCLAMGLDALLGEPRWLWSRLPHPAVLMGRAVDWLDGKYNNGDARRAKGIGVMAALAGGAIALGLVLSLLPWWVQGVVAATLLAQRSLCQHVSDVARALRRGLDEGRTAVSMIVGRETATLDRPAIARAAIESAAENLSDGVIAPVLFTLVFGLPGLLLYKITNTADSMIGYRTPAYKEFGWAAARFDDLLNLLPARLTAFVILAVHGRFDDWQGAIRDARVHRSPNAGWPEAAMSRVLGVALSGPRVYHGQRTDDPFVNPDGRRDTSPADIDRAVATLWRVWAAFGAVAVICVLL